MQDGLVKSGVKKKNMHKTKWILSAEGVGSVLNKKGSKAMFA